MVDAAGLSPRRDIQQLFSTITRDAFIGSGDIVTAILKVCPRCAHKVKPTAAICPKCRRLFTDADDKAFAVSAAKLQAEITRKSHAATWGCVGIGVVFGLVVMLSAVYHQSTTSPDELRKEKLANCFVGSDGHNFDLVEKVKANLRDPDSFQHIETRFAPAADGTSASAEMRYRARNGFGGMNVAIATATVDPDTCEATITASSED